MHMRNIFSQMTSVSLTVIVLLFGVSCELFATPFVVTNLADAGPGTLRQAIFDANNTTGDDTISFATNGTITLTTELPAITDNTAILGPGVDLLKISGNSLVRVFSMNAGTTNLLSDLTVADGFADGMINYTEGPALSKTNASGIASAGVLTIKRCVVKNCLVDHSLGAGVYNSGYLEMEQCVIADCKRIPGGSYTVRGAGVYNIGTVRMADCVITNCHGYQSGLVGSGIYNGGQLFAVNTLIERCSGPGQSDGGGIGNTGEAVLQACQIRKCSGFWGGGIASYGTLIMTNTIVDDCGAEYGGGIFLFGGTGLFEGCTISSNECFSSGGGVFNVGSVLMYNCTLSGNSGGYYALGPAIADKFSYYTDKPGTTFLNHCTVVSNINFGRAEIRVLGTFSASSSILGSLKGTNNSGGDNLIMNTNDCVIKGTEAGNIYNANPLLGPLQDNGGFTFTHALLPGSPAIDHADANDLLTDQRGVSRPVGPLARDIGAFEVVPASPPTLAINLLAPSGIVVSWPSRPAAFVLQQNSGFDSNTWADVNAPLNNDGITRWVVLPVNGDNSFYRLRSP